MARFRKPLFIFLGILTGIILLAVIAAVILGPRIKGIAIEQINSRLSVPIQVEDVQFSLLRKFPYASIDFIGVKTNGISIPGNKEPLLNAEHVFLLFNLFDVFSENLRLKKIAIQDAQLNLYIDASGNTNYTILKKDDSKNNHFNLELEEVELNHVSLNYKNIISRRDYKLEASTAKIKGKFNERLYDLEAEGNIFVQQLVIDKVNYIDHKESTLSIVLHIDNQQGLYDFRKAIIQIADLNLELEGRFRDEQEGMHIDLNVKSKDAGLKELLSLIPGVFTEKLRQYRYDGAIYFNMQINGLSTKNQTPLVTASFGTENASLMPKSSDYKLNKIRFKGNYTSRISNSKPVSRIQLTGVEALLEGQPIKANLMVEDFSNPSIELNAHSTINLEVLSRFYMPDTLKSISGNVRIDATIRGNSNDKTNWISNGTMKAENVNFRLKSKDIDFTGFNGVFELQGNQLTVKDFRGNAAGSDFLLHGSFENIYGYLLTANENLNARFSLTSKNIDLNEILEDKHLTTATDTSYRLEFSPRINLTMQVAVGILSFRKFQAWQMKGQVSLHNKVLSTNNLTFKACEGNVMLQGSMDASHNDSILFAYDVDVKKLNINQLFYEMGNFGQDVIIDKNVNGKITATVQFASLWSKTLHCNSDKIYAKCNLLIENGELNDFQPMLALSKYLKGADLRKIKFNTLKNQIEIKNQVITFPAMQISSNAMDLTASGTHTFNNVVDYKLQLLLSQLIGKKVKEQNTEFGTIEDDGLGRIKLFLNMKGPLENPKITYDRKGVEQKIAGDIKQEKQNLKGILKQEFGWFKKDSLKSNQPAPKPKQQELQLDNEE